MAVEQSRNAITRGDQKAATRGELYGTAASLCVLLFMVLTTSSRPEGDWLRILTMCFVIGLQIFYVGVTFWLRSRPAGDETRAT